MALEVRRIVTGHDSQGKAVVEFEVTFALEADRVVEGLGAVLASPSDCRPLFRRKFHRQEAYR